MKRKCYRCGRLKKLQLFASDSSKKFGKKGICKVCVSIRDKKIIVLEFHDIHKEVKNCEICGVKSDSLHNDHDHSSGYFRGKLCPSCNKALGSFKDSPGLLRKAAGYLEKHLALVETLSPTNESSAEDS